jgi:hypothetical protein
MGGASAALSDPFSKENAEQAPPSSTSLSTHQRSFATIAEIVRQCQTTFVGLDELTGE